MMQITPDVDIFFFGFDLEKLGQAHTSVSMTLSVIMDLIWISGIIMEGIKRPAVVCSAVYGTVEHKKPFVIQ